jgi:hypothetical protein
MCVCAISELPEGVSEGIGCIADYCSNRNVLEYRATASSLLYPRHFCTSINIVAGLEKRFMSTAPSYLFSSRLNNIDMMLGMLSSYSKSTCDVK